MAMATMPGTMQRAFSARRFIGKDVLDVNGQHVGEIEDLVMDMQTGCAQYVVLSSGGVLGIGEKYFVAPMQALQIDHEGRIFVSIDRSRFTNAPTYDRNRPPDFSDEQWASSVRSYYGVGGSGMQQQGMQGGQGMQGQGMQGQGMQQQGMQQQGMQGQGMQGGEYQQGYEQGYRQAQQQGGTGQGSTAQGTMRERSTGSTGWTGDERRHSMQGTNYGRRRDDRGYPGT